MSEIESCWRCGAQMLWVQSTWQCPRCRWKLGCCEGEPQSACLPATPKLANQVRVVETRLHP